MTNYKLQKESTNRHSRYWLFSAGRGLTRHGFGVIEILIVAAMISAALISFSEVARISLRLMQDEKASLEASFLIQEGFEGVRALRDQSWTSNISNRPPGIDHFLSAAGGSWALGTAVQPNINGKYFRTLVFDSVNRDGNDRVAQTGVNDPGTKKLTITVSWKNRSATSSVSAAGYITNFLQN